jgi:Serine endopeptidase inhibitors
MNRKNKDLPKKPFFARFLEKQELQDVTGGDGRPPFVTHKFPSDSDEGGVEIQ